MFFSLLKKKQPQKSIKFSLFFSILLYFHFNNRKKMLSKLGWVIPRRQFQTSIFWGWSRLSLFPYLTKYDNTSGICFLDVESSVPELSCSWIPDLWIEFEIRTKKLIKMIIFTYSLEFCTEKTYFILTSKS